MINSIKQIKGLKKVTIRRPAKAPCGNTRYSESLANLIHATPNLEFLTMDHLYLGFLNLQPQALSSLKYLVLLDHEPTETAAVSHLCKHIKETVILKVIKYCSAFPEPQNIGLVLEALRETLEGLITEIIPSVLLDPTLDYNFPKSCVQKSFCGNGEIMASITNVSKRPNCGYGMSFWTTISSEMGESALVKPPSLKRIIFTLEDADVDTRHEPLL